MFRTLRIIFSVLAAAGFAVAIMIFVYFGWIWGTVTLALSLIFAGAMYVCRNKQLSEEKKLNPPEHEGDFITGKKKNDE